MPVALPSLEPKTPVFSPPTAVVWMPVLVIFLIVGAAIAVLSTTTAEVQADPVWFWLRLIAFPFVAWTTIFGLRLHFYDTRTAMREGEIVARQEAWNEAVSFGQDPLALIGLACLCAFPEGKAAQAIANGEILLHFRETWGNEPVLRYTSLVGAGKTGQSLSARYRAAFAHILQRLAPQLLAIPPEIPFGVHLQLPAAADTQALLTQWTQAWAEQKLFPAKVTLLPEAIGMMMLDKWLDFPEGPALERFELVVAVQLYDDPPADSAEVAVGMLLAWSCLAAREKIAAIAHIHRPVSANGAEEFPGRLKDGLLWGKLEDPDVQEIWQADETRQGLFLKNAGGMAVLEADGMAGFHNIADALGHAGGATEWLALALAAERAEEVGKPQCVACGHQGEPALFRLAVVRPVPEKYPARPKPGQKPEPETPRNEGAGHDHGAPYAASGMGATVVLPHNDEEPG